MARPHIGQQDRRVLSDPSASRQGVDGGVWTRFDAVAAAAASLQERAFRSECTRWTQPRRQLRVINFVSEVFAAFRNEAAEQRAACQISRHYILPVRMFMSRAINVSPTADTITINASIGIRLRVACLESENSLRLIR